MIPVAPRTAHAAIQRLGFRRSPRNRTQPASGNETAPMDCCVDAAEVPAQVPATANTTDSIPVAAPVLAQGTLAPEAQGAEKHPPAPPPRPHAPLYHLHAALLI